METGVMKTSPKKDSELFANIFRQFEAVVTSNSKPKFEQLFGLFDAAFRNSRSERVDATPHLDVLEIFGLAKDELRHSRVLAWFLRHDAEHEQGSTCTQALLRLAAGKQIPELNGAALIEDYVVEREKHKRTDVSVYQRKGFAMFIENKVRHLEREDQVSDMIRELVRFSDAERIPIPYRFAIFVTDEGRDPISGPSSDIPNFERRNLKSFRRVDVFDTFQNALDSQPATSPLLKSLLSCYLNAIRQLTTL